ncbi:GAF domain-containing protein [Phormidium sp. CLA17]|uniref:ATP-binding protein n=1 Tax=Leptolyngbya sp. Cla-17 TaxID=2803751 RepID=UPI0014909487|nr:ATP-binding protein [Leptolyngbya sp. Cla-17]MBM0741612.1 GAF domain-containing protein [Leptolyngbya sp. Cla-17]
MNPALEVIHQEREPIHMPGSIQPHGLLCVLSELDLRITQVSQNAINILGIAPETLIDRPLADFIDCDRIAEIRACLDPTSEQTNPLNLSVTLDDSSTRFFNGIVHRAISGEIVLELEPIAATAKRDFTQSYRNIKDTLAKIQGTKTLSELCDLIVKEVRQITGFDRVMVYRFNQDGDGTVIAEDKKANLETFLGLYYPDTDIPQRAKHLYRLNWLRLLPDVNCQPSLLTGSQVADAKLDMSHCVLRSLSPCHIQYLQNMKVGASMSISLIQQQRLWGMIACHHNTPKFVPYEIRTICEFLGQLMSTELSVKEANQNLSYKLRLKATQVQFVNRLTNATDFLQALEDAPDDLLYLTGAQGAAVCEGDAKSGEQRIALIGNTPGQEAVLDLLEWLPNHFKDDLFVTDSLPKLYPAASVYKNVASGLLAMAISKPQHRYVLWFRPEFLQTVTWAGNPDNPKQIEADGSVTFSPRQSFAAWQETVRFKSLNWLQCEIEVAIELRSLIVDVILAQSDEMARVNLELKRSNTELDSFAYIASHDLKEPLRGIHNYSNFLMEDYAEVLPEDGLAKLHTVVRLTQRMDDLISSLMHYSQLGRGELSRQSVDLNALVQQTINTLKISQPQKAIEFRLPQPLPTICCDRSQVSELFTNLIGNAIKYNDKAEPWVEIGYVESKPVRNGTQLAHTLYIRDNSIGIPAEHLERIFEIFKRLHPQDRYGGGTGAGLTIVRKIVERHEGKIWVESTPGEGSTFYFTLLEAVKP